MILSMMPVFSQLDYLLVLIIVQDLHMNNLRKHQTEIGKIKKIVTVLSHPELSICISLGCLRMLTTEIIIC